MVMPSLMRFHLNSLQHSVHMVEPLYLKHPGEQEENKRGRKAHACEGAFTRKSYGRVKIQEAIAPRSQIFQLCSFCFGTYLTVF